VALARARRPQKEDIFPTVGELATGKLVDETAVHLLVEVEIEGVDGLVAVPELRLLGATFEKTIASSCELVADE
jgi:hypothetical protein